eukprot:12516948-Alexandrium_andersonii.AAC.1
MGAGAASSSGSWRGREEPEGRSEPAFAGGGRVRGSCTGHQRPDVGHRRAGVPEANTDDVDEEMSFLVNLVQEGEDWSQEGSDGLRLRTVPDPCHAPDLIR